MSGNDPFTKILLHFNGTDASTTFTDSNIGGGANTWTAAGNAQIDTAISKFGGAAGLFDGTGDFITAPDSADFTLGASDFTIDTWINRNGTSGGKSLAGHCTTDGSAVTSAFQLGTDASNFATMRINDGASTTTLVGTTALTGSNFHHIAFVRSGSTVRLMVDGVIEDTDTFTGTVPNPTTAFHVGRAGQTGETAWLGSIDEFRLSVGIARWTANFTPPTAAYDEIQDAVGVAVGAGVATGVGAATAETVGAASGTGTALADSTGSGVNEGVGTATGTGEAHGVALDLTDVVGSCAAYTVRGHLGAAYDVTGEARV